MEDLYSSSDSEKEEEQNDEETVNMTKRVISKTKNPNPKPRAKPEVKYNEQGVRLNRFGEPDKRIANKSSAANMQKARQKKQELDDQLRAMKKEPVSDDSDEEFSEEIVMKSRKDLKKDVKDVVNHVKTKQEKKMHNLHLKYRNLKLQMDELKQKNVLLAKKADKPKTKVIVQQAPVQPAPPVPAPVESKAEIIANNLFKLK